MAPSPYALVIEPLQARGVKAFYLGGLPRSSPLSIAKSNSGITGRLRTRQAARSAADLAFDCYAGYINLAEHPLTARCNNNVAPAKDDWCNEMYKNRL